MAAADISDQLVYGNAALSAYRPQDNGGRYNGTDQG